MELFATVIDQRNQFQESKSGNILRIVFIVCHAESLNLLLVSLVWLLFSYVGIYVFTVCMTVIFCFATLFYIFLFIPL